MLSLVVIVGFCLMCTYVLILDTCTLTQYNFDAMNYEWTVIFV